MKHCLSSALVLSSIIVIGTLPVRAASPASTTVQTAEAEPAKVGGGYHCTVETDNDEFDVELAIYQNGSRLKGTASGQAGGFDITGTVSGNTVTLTWYRPIGGKEIPFTLKGEFKDEKITGTADLSSIGKGTFTAERFME